MARPRILFLFNHDAGHQVAHLAGVARAMASLGDVAETLVAVAPEIAEAVRDAIGDAARHVTWIDLSLPPSLDRLAGFANAIVPARRILRLRHFAPLFGSCAMVVSTERTCLRAKAYMTGAATLFAAIPHGAGDRNVSYHPDYRRFDLVLVAGRKVRDAMVAMGVERDRIRITGYPKFDSVSPNVDRRWFGTDSRPTILYNPHFDPHLSSWYDEGPALLRWAATSEGGRAFTWIFAPHVMLWRKKLHISPEYRRARLRPAIPTEALSADNILIDTGSARLFDMSYTASADIYVGDMSSQIYEYLARPRPSFFIDTHRGQETEPEANHLHWRAGPVVKNIAELAALLPDYAAIGAQYYAAQQTLFADTFDQAEQPATKRAASALLNRCIES